MMPARTARNAQTVAPCRPGGRLILLTDLLTAAMDNPG
jgi:hypothetical protein